jgi:hypothetical protein
LPERAPVEKLPFRVERSGEGSDEPKSDLTVQVYLEQGPGVSDAEMRHVAEQAFQAATDISGSDHQLPWGDRPVVNVRFIMEPENADLHAVVDPSRPPGHEVWALDSSPETLAGRIREHLGLPAEHADGVGFDAGDMKYLGDRIAQANTEAPLRGLPETREIGPGKLAPLENPSYQKFLQQTLREDDHYATWFDPRTHDAGKYINDGGVEVPGRSNSCGEATLAGWSSFYGIRRSPTRATRTCCPTGPSTRPAVSRESPNGSVTGWARTGSPSASRTLPVASAKSIG